MPWPPRRAHLVVLPSHDPSVTETLATASITGHDKGGFYGIETTPRRMLSEALNARTPIPGLYLTGQDVMMPGIAGALWGGLLGAAAVDPRVFQKFK